MRALVASACLLLSGAAALVYEICWIRRGALVFGSASFATSTLLAVFFAGLALGSWLAAAFLNRVARPLRVYAGVELAIAVLAASTLWLFDVADPLYGAVHRAFADAPVLRASSRAALVAAIILPPTVLMGVTLPLLCAHVCHQPGRIVGSVSLLYGANTLGAAAGCLAAGLVLVPRLGLTATVLLGTAANALAAGLALVAARREGPVPRPVAPAPAASGRTAASIWLLAFGAGFAALGYEVLWTRFLALVVPSSVTTYTLSLTAVLIGIVAGSLLAPRLARDGEASGRTFGVLQMLAGLYVLALLLLPPAVWRGLGGDPLVCLALFLPAAALSGASFPLAVRAAAVSAGPLGAHVGRVSAANTLGGIAGSLAVGFVGLPLLGLQASLLIATAVSVAVGLTALVVLAPPGRLGTLAVATFAVAAWLVIPAWLPTRLPSDFLADGGVLVAHREGQAANVAVVRRNGVLELRLDRWWQGEDRRTHQAVSAHLPMLLHPGARSVLVVGAGTGQTASRFLLHPIERLDVVEIEPAVLDVIAEHFDAGWIADHRVALLRDDGRNVLRHSARRYDIVSLEVGQVLRPGVASFYTAELYAHARERLLDGGLLCQFVPLAFLRADELRRVVATFRSVFPASLLWYNTSELLMIGVRGDTLGVDPGRFDLVASDAHLRADLDLAHWGDRALALNRPEVLLAGFLAGPAGLRELAHDAAPYGDDRPELEVEAGRADRSRTAELDLVPLLRAHVDSFDAVVTQPLPPERRAFLVAQRERNLDDMIASALVRHADELAAGGDLAGAHVLVARALTVNPDSTSGLRLAGNLAFAAGETSEARRRYEEVLRRDPDDALALRGLGRVSLLERRIPEAEAFYLRSLAVRPNDAETHNSLGAILASRRDFHEALEHFRAAARLDPRDRGARDNLVRLEAMLGR